ncbi:hypothetical protein Enr17x_37960 [Gimesia fumaroli]|uniref:Uncharacterized protein n=1 Tax=Gimesia fumaroli TaxID=2527976 RepID=A0A518IFA3_9PLAN|nr:hypothetical protein Enr17x_37960 [Gimesia fumaroli]
MHEERTKKEFTSSQIFYCQSCKKTNSEAAKYAFLGL